MIDSLIKRLQGEPSQRRFASLSDTVVYEWFTLVMKASTKICQMASEEKVAEEKDVTTSSWNFFFGLWSLWAEMHLTALKHSDDNNSNNNNNNMPLSHFRCVGICHLLWTVDFASWTREGHAENKGNLIWLSLWKSFLGVFHFQGAVYEATHMV